MSKYRFDQIAINSTAKKKPTEEDKYHYIGLEHIDSQNLIVSRWGSEVAPKGDKLLMKKGDVLFGKRRAYQKKVAIAPFDGIFSAHGMVLRPNEKVIDKDFFPMFISSDYFLDTAIAISVGSLSPTINWKDLARLEFDLPPMEEQKKLAKALWSINDTLQAYQKLLIETDALVQAQFIEMFEGKGFPRSTIGHECKLKSGFTFSLESEIPEGDILYAKVSDMSLNENQKYMITSKTYVTRETAGNTIIPSGSVIFPKRGAAIATNKKRITTQPICVDLNIMAVTPKHLNIQYVYQYFINLDMATIYNGSSIPQINNKDIAPLEIIVPPQKTQEEFAYFAYRAEQTESALQNAITSLQSTKRCILENTLGTGRKE